MFALAEWVWVEMRVDLINRHGRSYRIVLFLFPAAGMLENEECKNMNFYLWLPSYIIYHQ